MLTDLAITAFESQIKGKVFFPGTLEYEKSRKVFNGMIDKYPALIVQCAGEDDVIACLAYAKENDIKPTIKAGGHSAGGWGVGDGTIVLDLRRMNTVVIDSSTQTVLAGGGCTLAELDAATQEEGLIVPSGVFSSTGIGGLTLGGGLGHLTRRFGLAIDNLLEASVVLADGSCVKASAHSHKDLFWALRGGGGNFGVVTSFLFKSHPLKEVFGGPMFWYLEDAATILPWYQQMINVAPDSVTGFFAFLGFPSNDHFPPELHGKKMCAIIWCCTGEESEANHFFEQARSCKLPVIDHAGLIPFDALQKLFDPIIPPGLDMYWKGDFVNTLNEEAIAAHLQFGGRLPTWQSGMHLYPVNGAASRIGKHETAWNYRGATWAMTINGISDNKSDRELISNWSKDYWQALRPFSAGGSYVNFMREDDMKSVQSSYGDNFERLRQVKKTYDPQNLFSANQNIPPA